MITIQNDYLQVGIEPFGAELSCLKNRQTEREYIWCGNREIWSGQAPILFPICGRLHSDCFEFDGKKYYLPKHGFARKSLFSVEEAEETRASFLLRSGEETKRVYPFDFELRVSYELREKSLNVTYSVKNTGDAMMFFSIGAHPAFVCRMGDKIVFDERETASVYLYDDSLRIGEIPFLRDENSVTVTEHIFDNDCLFFHSLKSKGAELLTASGERIVRMDFGDVPYLGLWAKPGAPFVCIEPWFGIGDTKESSGILTEKEGILSLAPDQTFDYSFTVSV